MISRPMLRLGLEKFAKVYFLNPKKAKKRFKKYSDFEVFLSSRAADVLAHTSSNTCPFCEKKFSSWRSLVGHLKGEHGCAVTFRQLIMQLVDEYLSQKRSGDMGWLRISEKLYFHEGI